MPAQDAPPRAAEPQGPDEIQVATVELAADGGGVPFEEEPVHALRPEAVHEVLAAVPSSEMAEAFRASWTAVVAAVPGAASLGEAFAAARRREEHGLGLRNLELPVSALADSASFLLFVAEMLRRREEVFAACNDSLHEYRRVYRERSAAQPLPDLGRNGERLELPLWAWQRCRPRRRLWCEPASGGGLMLWADDALIGLIDGDSLRRADETAARLREFREAGWKIRPRALSMTLFARMAVGDVFIHGLGGALYDKITDGIFERFFGVQPPEYVLASCTVRLPLEGYPSTPRDLGAAQRAVRDWRFNPDRVLSAAALARPEVQTLVAEKRRLIEGMSAVARGEAAYWAAASREARRRAYLRIHEVNALLAALEPAGPPAAADTLARVQRELRYNAILWDREYPFWLYPPEDLEAFYWQCLEPAAGAAGDPQRG